jgi:polyhydroxybutyrate depolymerase
MDSRTPSRARRIAVGVVVVGLLLAAAGPSPTAAGVAGQTEPTGPAPSAGCGVSQAGPLVEQERHLDVGGSDRWFLLTVPGAHDGSTPLPVVFSFHGLSEGAVVHTLMSEYSGIAEREGFVVVFPQGRFNPVRWDADPNSDPNEDVQFVEEILETLGDELCLDERRVYASGLSYGAFMTSLVTCKLSHRFAAVAPVAGIRLTDPCPQDRAVPIVTFHGTDDAIVLFNGGFGPIPVGTTAGGRAPTDADLDGPGTPAYVRGWADRNGCDPTPTDTQTSDEILHRVYDCPAGADVEFYIVLGGGHTWPGSEFSQAIEAIVGHTTFDIHASEVAWEFFQQFQLPCPEGQSCADPPAPGGPSTAPAGPSTAPAGASTAPAVSPSFTG